MMTPKQARILPGLIKGFSWVAASSAILFSHLSLSQPSTLQPADDFCVQAMRSLTGLSLPTKNVIHDGNIDAFIKSKATLEPLSTSQFHYHEAGEGGTRSLSVSCKSKSPDILLETFGAAAFAGGVQSGDCRAINQDTLAKAASKLAPESLKVKPSSIVFDEDDTAYIGPFWLKPWPYVVAYRDDKTLHIRSKSLYVPNAWWIPMPDRFKGTHYCHLISPGHATDLLTGFSSAPTLVELGE